MEGEETHPRIGAMDAQTPGDHPAPGRLCFFGPGADRADETAAIAAPGSDNWHPLVPTPFNASHESAAIVVPGSRDGRQSAGMPCPVTGTAERLGFGPYVGLN